MKRVRGHLIQTSEFGYGPDTRSMMSKRKAHVLLNVGFGFLWVIRGQRVRVNRVGV